MISYFCFFFFFSSRRRHTRFDCDWSSDVCSSDLLPSEEVAKEKQVQVMTALRTETDEEIEAQIRDGAYKSKQASLFQQQLDLAVELGLNVVIHQRDGWEDTLEIMQPYAGKLRGVFHCFGGTLEQANEV